MTDRAFTTADKVYAIVSDVCETTPDKITRDTEFVSDLGADQLDLLEIATLCKQTFDIDLPHQDLERLSTVGMLYDYVFYFTSEDRRTFDYD